MFVYRLIHVVLTNSINGIWMHLVLFSVSVVTTLVEPAGIA